MAPSKKIEAEIEKRAGEIKPKRSKVTFDQVSNLQEMQNVKELEDQSVSFHSDYMQQFVGEDCKIYGYKGLKDGETEKKPTDLIDLMKKIFGQGLVEDCDTFLQTFSSDNQRIENLIFNSGEVISSHDITTDKTLSLQGDSGRSRSVASEKIVHLELIDPGIWEWHTRLALLILLLVEGNQPIEQDDTKWEIDISIQR